MTDHPTKSSAFYREQAAIQQRAAEEAGLANVRERCERAAASWEAMAQRAELTERRRGAVASATTVTIVTKA